MHPSAKWQANVWLRVLIINQSVGGKRCRRQHAVILYFCASNVDELFVSPIKQNFDTMARLIDRLPIIPLALLAATLGLAPFVPEPHVWEKLRMLVGGSLVKAVDWFDLAMHGVPWVLLGLKLAREFMRGSAPRG